MELVGAGLDLCGNIHEASTTISRLLPEKLERFVDGDTQFLRKNAFRLLDDDPAVEGVLELRGEGVACIERVLLKDAQGGGVRESLNQGSVTVGQRAGRCGEQAQRTQGLVSQTHRCRMNGLEAFFLSDASEVGPLIVFSTEVRGLDGVTAVDAVPAGPLSCAKLGFFDVCGSLVGGGYDVQRSVRAGKDDAALGRRREFGARFHQPVQDLEDVACCDAVGQAVEHVCEIGCGRHLTRLCRTPAEATG